LLILQVYNWTDSPSIVSRERLLILDPHFNWSEGGPVYDFVKDSGDIAMQNQMAAFQTVVENPNQPFDGTVIRIPLRTRVQADDSKISNSETTVEELLKVLQKFADEFANSGLLFLRNIEKLGIESTTGMSIEIKMVDCEKVRT
jgi:sacsin